MSAFEIALFYVAAATAVAGALGTVLARSPIRSATGLLFAILGIAGLFVTLSAQLLAAIQILVYAGAIVVLFVFVIMLLGGRTGMGPEDRTRRARIVGTGLFAAASAIVLLLVGRAGLGGPHAFDPAPAELGTVYQMGRVIFTDGVVAFELAGVLLLAAIVGVMGVARSRHDSTPALSSGGTGTGETPNKEESA